MPLANTRDLTDGQWEVLDKLIPEPTPRNDGRGRPWKDRRAVLNGILWVLRSGAPWADVPERYPSYQTCHRRFRQWVRSEIMKAVLEVLALDLKARGVLDVEEAFIDGSFAPAKKGAVLKQDPVEETDHQISHRCSAGRTMASPALQLNA
jgi:transposase